MPRLLIRRTNGSVRDEIVAIILVAVGIFFHNRVPDRGGRLHRTVAVSFLQRTVWFCSAFTAVFIYLYGVLLFMRKTIHVGVKSAVLACS